MPWQFVSGFGDLTGNEPFRCADELARLLRADARRLKAEALCALLVPFHDFCSPSEPRITWRLSSPFVDVLGAADRLLVISGASAREAVEELLGYLERTSSEPAPQWLAEPAGEGPESPSEEPARAGHIVLDCGVRHEFSLSPLGSTVTARRLRGAGRNPKIPEGPDNLSRREAWFRGKSGRPGPPISGS